MGWSSSLFIQQKAAKGSIFKTALQKDKYNPVQKKGTHSNRDIEVLNNNKKF